MDFTQCVDVAINIFGIDVNGLIINTPKLAQAFYEKMFTADSHAKYREIRNSEYRGIWSDQKMTVRDKHEYFAKLFAQVSKKYKMPAKTLRFIEDKKIAVICVPNKAVDLNNIHMVIDRISELIRYCLLAYHYFHFQFDSFLIEEDEVENEDALQIWIKKEELKLLSEGQSSYLDLIHDGNIYKNKTNRPITVDFDALNELDIRSLSDVIKRKSP
ncbi:hypothetical protein [Pedobacter sp. MC2016-24]|uniref:hypothetical protein n=1 Tax=Pedobacter sp. MC2016-24 TaxID=2780090 RepID=UPI001881C999|nr:hypothetical protein [Pedobacter sp. MC2016-24]MBE9601493.1 hypothetical protein [Pedobacter sp. MC2016-24]